MLRWKPILQTYMLQVFRCFRDMLQVFYIGVTKVDWGVAHVAKAMDVRFKCMFQIFHLMLQAYVSSVSGASYICCKCFI
jgi:hypothetical protein